MSRITPAVGTAIAEDLPHARQSDLAQARTDSEHLNRALSRTPVQSMEPAVGPDESFDHRPSFAPRPVLRP